MAKFRQTVLTACWVIPALAGFYFWVVTLSTFNASSTKPATSPTPPPLPTKCTTEAIKNNMDMWMRWMTLFLIVSISILCCVRKIVEDIADAEAKGNSFEEEAHKISCEDLKQAIKDVNDALATLAPLIETASDVKDGDKIKAKIKAVDKYVEAVGKQNMAIAKAERTKPKQGLARLPRGRQQRVRLSFFSAVFFSFCAAVCASVLFYLSLRLQIGCTADGVFVDGVVEITPFVFVGFLFLAVHVLVACKAFTEE